MLDTQTVHILRIDGPVAKESTDEVVSEEPLEIRANNESIGITMRTPGDDFDLAAGLLWTEGHIRSVAEIGTIAYCPNESEPQLKNVINVTLVDTARRFEASRKTWSNSSCGLCGKATIESIRREVQENRSAVKINTTILLELSGRMRSHQTNFNRTGGIHAACLFDAAGELLLIREDLGRHNAVDKALGAAFRAGVPLNNAILMVSGRLGFEIAQKAAVAGVPVVASVSAPSSLALDLAREIGMTAIGFLRDQSLNVYSHPQRVIHGIPKHPA